MLVETRDFNGADRVLRNDPTWAEIQAALEAMPVHVKLSDQKGKQTELIFDPVGTNAQIGQDLGEDAGWTKGPPLPEKYERLGIGVDFAKNGVVVEAQFSNYPFFFNNIVRMELLYRAQQEIDGRPIRALVVIAKAKLFPASNSTLYFEQALGQIEALGGLNFLTVPIRLVSLSAKMDEPVAMRRLKYPARYSRDPETTTDVQMVICRREGSKVACRIVEAVPVPTPARQGRVARRRKDS